MRESENLQGMFFNSFDVCRFFASMDVPAPQILEIMIQHKPTNRRFRSQRVSLILEVYKLVYFQQDALSLLIVNWFLFVDWLPSDCRTKFLSG
jgi:hypothetical protein